MQICAKQQECKTTVLPSVATLCKTVQHSLGHSVVRCSIQLSYGRPRERGVICGAGSERQLKLERSEYDGLLIYCLRLRFGKEGTRDIRREAGVGGIATQVSKGRIAVLLSQFSLSSMNADVRMRRPEVIL